MERNRTTPARRVRERRIGAAWARLRLALLGMSLAAGSLAGCSDGGAEGGKAAQEPGARATRARPDSAPEPAAAALVHADGPAELPPLLLDEYRGDVTGDGRQDSVQLRVQAERDTRGRLMLDDGQRWALVARVDGRAYALFNEFVQLAAPRFVIVEERDDAPPVIALILDSGAGLVVQTFAWDATSSGFRRSEPVRVVGNRLFTSPAH